MNRILINGNFLCRNLTGIERFAWEVLARMDKCIKDEDISIYIPANAKVFPEYKNIHIVISEKQIRSFPLWDLFYFKGACKKLKATGLNFSNTAPLGKYCGFAFLHDIYAKDFPKDFAGFKDKLIKIYCRLNYRNIAKNAKKVLTVSEFSAARIKKAYNVPDEKIKIIPNGWEHFKDIIPDGTVFEKFPSLKKGSYYFTLGSLSKRKNLRWIAEYAKEHPEEHFAVSGKAISGLVPPELKDLQTLKNVTLLGYVSDEQVKCLMQNAAAFVFPSYYEGFGIPPLEALCCGTPAVISKSASLPGIYGTAAHYIDADSTNCSISAILKEPVSSPDEVLETYTYENAAKKLLDILQSC